MVPPTSPQKKLTSQVGFVRRSDHQILWHFPSWAPRIGWKFYILPSVTWPITGRGEEEGEKLEKTAALQQTFGLARGGPWTRQVPELLIQFLLFVWFSRMVPPTNPKIPKINDGSFVKRSDHQILLDFPSWGPGFSLNLYLLTCVAWPAALHPQAQ